MKAVRASMRAPMHRKIASGAQSASGGGRAQSKNTTQGVNIYLNTDSMFNPTLINDDAPDSRLMVSTKATFNYIMLTRSKGAEHLEV